MTSILNPEIINQGIVNMDLINQISPGPGSLIATLIFVASVLAFIAFYVIKLPQLCKKQTIDIKE